MKKVVAMVVCILLVTGVFSACSKKESTDTPSKDATSSEATSTGAATSEANDTTEENTAEATEKEAKEFEGQTVTVGRWGGNDVETAAFNKMVEDFTKETGIIVEERVYSDYNQELQAELIGGTAPDVFYVDAYMAPFYIQQEVLLPLDEVEMSLDQFYEPLKNAFLKDGTYYAVSKDYSTLALYYNKKYVEESAIPTTLEELFGSDFLVNLQATLSEGMIAMTYDQDLARNMFIAQAGGVDILKEEIYSNLSDPTVVENLSVLYDAATAGKIKTAADLGVGWNGDAFGNEKAAIMLEGNWTLGFLTENFPDVEFGVVEIPTYKGEKGTMVFTVGYGINAMSDKADAAKKFIKYATGPVGMATWTTGAGVLPSREDVTVATNVAADPNKAAHIAGAAYATPWQKGTTMDTINTEYRNYIPSVVTGGKSLEETLKFIDEEANSTIEANQ